MYNNVIQGYQKSSSYAILFLRYDTCVPKIMIRSYAVPEIWCAMDGRTPFCRHG